MAMTPPITLQTMCTLARQSWRRQEALNRAVEAGGGILRQQQRDKAATYEAMFYYFKAVLRAAQQDAPQEKD